MTDPQNRLAARKPATVGLLLTLTLLGVFPIDVVLPSFPALSEHFERPSSDIALSVSLFAVGIALSQLLVGPLSDVMGRPGNRCVHRRQPSTSTLRGRPTQAPGFRCRLSKGLW